MLTDRTDTGIPEPASLADAYEAPDVLGDREAIAAEGRLGGAEALAYIRQQARRRLDRLAGNPMATGLLG